MQTARIVLYNADHFDPHLLSGDKYQYSDTGIENRFAHIPGLLSALEPDMILMQEFYGTNQIEVENSARHLASTLGFSCEFQNEVTAASRSTTIWVREFYGGHVLNRPPTNVFQTYGNRLIL